MRSRPRVALHSTLALAVLAALVVVGTALPAAAAAPASGPTPAESTGSASLDTIQSESPSRNGTALGVQLQPDGDARWSVSTAFVLENESDRAAFDDLAERFERGDADLGFDLETFRRASSRADETVNRSMGIEDPQRNATVTTTDGTTVGRLTLSFTWTNFATVSGNRLQFGSAFNTPEGTWLPGLAAEQTLAIYPPEGFGGPVTATVPPRNGVLRWSGATDFERGDVAATYERQRTPTPTPTPSPSPSPTPSPVTDPPTEPRSDLLLVVGGVGGLVALAVVLVLVARRRPTDGGPTPAAGDDGGAPGSGSVAADTDGGSEAAAEGGAAGAVGAAAADDPEPELLSDEERVERLLERNGGRMKQASIVTETGWSNAKVSQLLSAMDDDDRVDKLRIGRENLITLPDEDVTELDEE
jgi:hypothetical protein